MDGLFPITDVQVTGNYSLRVTWENGRDSLIDMEEIVFSTQILGPLRDTYLFAQAETGPLFDRIIWPNGLSYSAAFIKAIAEHQKTITSEELRDWQNKLYLADHEAAEILGMSMANWKIYTQPGMIIPVQVSASFLAARV